MTQNLNHYEKILSRTHSNYLAQISIEMTDANNQINEVLSKLTALGTILIPMNLITGRPTALLSLLIKEACLTERTPKRYLGYERTCAGPKCRRFCLVLLYRRRARNDRPRRWVLCVQTHGQINDHHVLLSTPVSSFTFHFNKETFHSFGFSALAKSNLVFPFNSRQQWPDVLPMTNDAHISTKTFTTLRYT
jgi:hypothetical protein